MKVVVLIVEDEFLIRADAVGFMEDLGFIVYEAGNADEAIGLLKSHEDIRVVFTDIHMPGSMDGLKLAHYIRGRWPPPPACREFDDIRRRGATDDLS